MATKWMVDHTRANDDIQIASKCVKAFPTLFSVSRVANITKAMGWWTDRQKSFQLKVTGKLKGNFSFSTVHKKTQMRLKAVGGRAIKRAVWISYLYNDLREELSVFEA